MFLFHVPIKISKKLYLVLLRGSNWFHRRPKSDLISSLIWGNVWKNWSARVSFIRLKWTNVTSQLIIIFVYKGLIASTNLIEYALDKVACLEAINFACFTKVIILHWINEIILLCQSFLVIWIFSQRKKNKFFWTDVFSRGRINKKSKQNQQNIRDGWLRWFYFSHCLIPL